jgi:hypothetical protein
VGKIHILFGPELLNINLLEYKTYGDTTTVPPDNKQFVLVVVVVVDVVDVVVVVAGEIAIVNVLVHIP